MARKFNNINRNENAQENWKKLSTYLNFLTTDGKKDVTF